MAKTLDFSRVFVWQITHILIQMQHSGGSVAFLVSSCNIFRNSFLTNPLHCIYIHKKACRLR